MRTALLAVLLALGLAAPSSAAVIQTYKGAPGPGPAKYDKVLVEQFGPASARTVLVLVPGTQGGAGDYAMLGPEIAGRVSDLQVWAMDRRSYQLEDTTGFDTGDADEAFRYYLGGGGFAPPTDADTPWARKWGLKLALEDLRRVVKQAGKGGRRVILGGHSLGASEAVAYAAWDFKGKPGWKDLDGLVLIDGGLRGTFDEADLDQAKQRLADIQSGSPWLDLLDAGVPWAAGILLGVGGLYASNLPDEPSPVQDFVLLPAAFKPPFPATNAALLAYAFDRDTSPAALRLLHINGGSLATSGAVRGWVDGGVTPVARLAKFAARSPVNSTEWFFPRKLTLDVDAASPLRQTKAARFLGLRLKHAKRIKLPLYAFQTDLTDGGVLRGARKLKAMSRIPRATLVDGAPEQSHLDPLLAAPKANEFLKTVVPFLRGL
ncbi:MAG: alpha/beta hydrolase [Solirubrobacteraceae bacterium]